VRVLDEQIRPLDGPLPPILGTPRLPRLHPAPSAVDGSEREIEVLTATKRARLVPESSLSWSFFCAHRIETLMLLLIVVVLAIAEAIVVAYVVTSLFEPITDALSPIT
jgi:hypothetical protein